MTCADLERSGRGGGARPLAPDILREALAHVRANDPDRALACLVAHIEVTLANPFACFLAGLIYVNKGNDAAALRFYERALALDPRCADALEGRAQIMHRAGRFKDAIADYDALFRIRPATAEGLSNLGAAFEAIDLRREAMECYNRALEAAPNHAPALAAKALLLYDDGHAEDALSILRAVLAANPSNASAWYNCGVIHATSGDHAEAHRSFSAAVELAPDYGKALYGAAVALQKLGRADEALAACNKLLGRSPSDFEARFLRGNLLFEEGRFVEALADFNAALAKNPKHIGVLCNRGAALREFGRLDEAAAMFDAALAEKPACVEALLGRGIVDFKSAKTEQSLAWFERAILADPASATAFCGRGLAMQHLGRIEEAKQDFEQSLSLQPDLAEGHSNLGALQLLLGDFERGWEGYEYRRIAGDRCKTEIAPRWPVWSGEEDIAGKKLIVLEEAAHGDAFLLARYFPMFAAHGIDATVECRPHMFEILRQVPGVRLVGKIDPEERFDYQIHFFSVPRAFKTRLGNIPGGVPYLKADPALAAKWAGRTGRHGFKIGIAWQGNPDPSLDMARSAPLKHFAPLAAIEGVRLISLQKGYGAEQIAGAGFPVETLGDDFDAGPNAFMDCAAVMANLDLIVSVDTSIAHLAGALGRPAWVALKHIPEWRWMLGRDDTPWYPAMRLFRQSAAGDWAEVFSGMAEAARSVVARERNPAQASLLIPGAVGELIDKLTILEIKAERIPDTQKLANVKRELQLLSELKQSHDIAGPRLDGLAADLKSVNEALWETEEAIRVCERKGDFGHDFIHLAREVYMQNDKRAALKREINVLFGSAIVEEKYFTAS